VQVVIGVIVFDRIDALASYVGRDAVQPFWIQKVIALAEAIFIHRAAARHARIIVVWRVNRTLQAARVVDAVHVVMASSDRAR
jgi:hypothetical protein